MIWLNGLGKGAKPFYVHLAEDFGIVAIGKFCDKIWVKLIGDREEFGNAFTVDVQFGGRGETGFVRVCGHEILHPERLTYAVLWRCRGPGAYFGQRQVN